MELENYINKNIVEIVKSIHKNLLEDIEKVVEVSDLERGEIKHKQVTLETPVSGGTLKSIKLLKFHLFDFFRSVTENGLNCISSLSDYATLNFELNIENFTCLSSIVFLIKDLKDMTSENIEPLEGAILYTLYAMEKHADPRIEPLERTTINILNELNKFYPQTITQIQLTQKLNNLSQLSCIKIERNQWKLIEKIEIKYY